MIKIVTFFLIAMMIVALASRWVRPNRKPPRLGRFCPNCGRPRIGTAPCDCGHGA